MSELSESELRQALQADPGDPAFVELAARLLQIDRRRDALDVCLAGLSASPGITTGRLILARALYELGYLPFAVREVERLCAEVPTSEALKRLLEKISGGTAKAVVAESAASESTTVAEAEFDFDDLEALSEAKDSSKVS